MDSELEIGPYPEGCDASGADCLRCVTRTAESVKALSPGAAGEWAAGMFRKMYTHEACRQMEHAFVNAMGVTAGPERLLRIVAA